jgi:hypothetical protein
LQAREEPSAAAAQPLPQRLGLDVVREGALAVHLDDRDRLAIRRFEGGIPADVDALEVAGADLVDDLERALAEMAVRGVVDDDAATDRGPA